MKHVIMALVLVLAVGVSCSREEPQKSEGVDAQRTEGAAKKPKQQKKAKKSKQPTKEDIVNLWTWPPDKGPARDLNEDSKACEAYAAEQTQGLDRLRVYGKCMVDKGWVTKKKRAKPEGSH